MNKLIAVLIGTFTAIATLPAVAGPDWQIIELGRKAKQAAAQETSENKVVSSGAAAERTCPPDRLVLGLDHGPRATTTPWLNQQRKERYEAQLKACQGQAR